MLWNKCACFVILSVVTGSLFSQDLENDFTKIMLGKIKVEHWLFDSVNIWKTPLPFEPMYVFTDTENESHTHWGWSKDTLYFKDTHGNPDSTHTSIYAVKRIGGWSVTSGDFNGDGVRDMVTMSSHGDSCFHVYYGKEDFSAFPDYSVKTAEIIFQVSSAGDINGDGYDDLLVAANWGKNKVYIYYGSANGIHLSAVTELTHDYDGFGHAMSTQPGDLNGDGYDDVLIGGQNPAFLSIYYGNAEGVHSVPDDLIEFAGSNVGSLPVSFIGDINHDSFEDLAVATGYSINDYKSRVLVYYGSPAGLDTTKSKLIVIDTQDKRTVYNELSISKANDVNNDGIDDLILGDEYADGLYDMEGRIYVFYGSDEGPADTPHKIINNPVPAFNTRFGYEIACVDDINKDEIDDIVVGSPYANRAYIFYGSSDGLSDTNSTSLFNPQKNDFGFSISAVGNIYNDNCNYFAVGEEFGISFLFGLKETATQIPLPKHQLDSKNEMARIYPNPAVDFFCVDMEQDLIGKIEIISSDGVIVSEQTYDRMIGIDALAKGFYIIRITTIDEKVLIGKLVK